MRVPTAPEQKIIRPLVYSRNIHELAISEHVIQKRNTQNETSCFIRMSHETHHVTPPLELQPARNCHVY
jgi:hypothetical protein